MDVTLAPNQQEVALVSEPQQPPFDPNHQGGATPPVPNPYADQPPAYGAPVAPAPYGSPAAPSPYGAQPPIAPPVGPPNPYGAPSPYATGPASFGASTPNSWRAYASFPLAAVALLFIPILFGGLSIVFASLAVQRKEKLGKVALIVGVSCTVIGMILGAIVANM